MRLPVEVLAANLDIGACPTLVHVRAERDPFTFVLRDVAGEDPVFLPDFGAAVLPDGDVRSYTDVARSVAQKRLVGDFQRMESEPEESYANACAHNRVVYCPTWLGVGRDIRIFHVGPLRLTSRGDKDWDYRYWGQIQPFFHSCQKPFADSASDADDIRFSVGPGAHCRPLITRRLEEGCLPILRSVQDEQSIQYHVTAFATMEQRPLGKGSVRGTDFVTGYAHTGGNMLTPEERDRARRRMAHDEEVVLLLRVEAVNVGRTPALAFFRAIHASAYGRFKNGYSLSTEVTGKCLAANRINGKPMPQSEMAIMVRPGSKAIYEAAIPHSPISDAARMKRLAKINFDAHLAACRRFWRDKLAAAATLSVPETAIDERVKAGLLHCDLATIGEEPDRPAMATVGWYAPIGTESAPIIQFFDSMGMHRLAERCIEFFLERQREDGFIQNFANYQSETGPLLWAVGEHFRYTRDMPWLRRAAPRLVKSCDYLLAWRERNKRPELRPTGCYGLVDGKVSDPNDFYHSFFLNAGTYLGLSRMAEALAHVRPNYARRLKAELPGYRFDIAESLRLALALAPVTPLADGTWTPWLPSWADRSGASPLYLEGLRCWTHGTVAARNCLTGPLWLGIGEVFDCRSREMALMLKANQHPVTRENAALSQPYYCRHDFAHLRRGEVKLFLKAYYNQLTALQDRETYTFWEHYYGVSQHKTHEEAWFLMQTRWMLYMEDGSRLDLFKGIPRQWLTPGRRIELDGVKSYFGALRVTAQAEHDAITCAFESERPIAEVRVRLPHPDERRAVACVGGHYDPATETVSVKGRRFSIRLTF